MEKKKKYEVQFSINQMLKDGIEINYFFFKKEKKSIITLIMSPTLTLRKKNHKKYKKAKLYIKKRIKKGKKTPSRRSS
jgi:hypothetical protein